MKKIILFLGIAFLISTQQNVIAQKNATKNAPKKLTEGVITYDLKVEGAEDIGMMAAMMPTEMVVKFKGTKSRSEFATGMSETVAITDANDDKSGVVLLDLMGNKYAMKIDEAKIAEQKASMPDYDVVETKEIKEIAGYSCKKVVLINKKTKEEVSVFYSTEIPFFENTFNAQFKQVNGMPMEFKASFNNINLTVTVKEIKKDKVDDSLFLIPSDYKTVSQEELMRELGAGE